MEAGPTIRLRCKLFVLEIVDKVTGEMTKACGCCDAVTGSEGATELMMVTVAGVDTPAVLVMVALWVSQVKVLPEVSNCVSTALCCSGGDIELDATTPGIGDAGTDSLGLSNWGGELSLGRWLSEVACLALTTTAAAVMWCLEPLCGDDMLRDLVRLLGCKATLGMAKLMFLPPTPAACCAWSAGGANAVSIAVLN